MKELIIFDYMYKDSIMTHVEVNYQDKSVKIINYTEDLVFRAFGINEYPTLEDFDNFLESRCFPKERRNCKQLLRDLDIIEYSPYLIVKKTHGRQLEDYCWIRFEGEDLDYERDIKLRD